MASNPFDTLYLTETVDPASFVTLFSPLLIHETASLFRPGNIILLGTQGSGKSMLLSLLKADTKLAFQRAGQRFPVEDIGQFIGAGTSLARTAASDFGQRPFGRTNEDSGGVVESHFADFLNYVVVEDLLISLKLHADEQMRPCLADSKTRLNAFARELSRDDCWNGYLSGVKSFSSLLRLVSNRIGIYRNFVNYNIEEIPPKISRTKTSAGQPISVFASISKAAGVIEPDANFYVRIDQYEDLERVESHTHYTGHLVSVVHKVLGLRDPHVSYRIGTRRYSWPDQPRMQGTDAVLEEYRNYKIVDLDAILRSTEHNSGRFRRFADDVFDRRVRLANYELTGCSGSSARSVLGRTMSPDVAAAYYAGNGRQRYIMPAEVSARLPEIASLSPLSAKLGEAWIRQGKQIPNLVAEVPPWEERSSQWWRKERVPQALLQLAAQQRQRMLWRGYEDCLRLAGFNILTFVSICQHVWDAWLQQPDSAWDVETTSLPSDIPTYAQDQGIQQASRYWYRKIRSDPDGDSRQHFVSAIGEMFRRLLRDDLKMSYPGHNGFSLSKDELERATDVALFLREAAAYGILFDREHVDRSKGGGKRIKWYLNPIYGPYFQIYTQHVKEPKYVRAIDVREWMFDAGVLARPPRAESPRSLQGTLF